MIKQMSISDISLNDMDPRQWEWKFPQLINLDAYDEDRFNCNPERHPHTKIMHTETMRARYFEMAVKRVEENDEEEVRQFRPIIIDEYGMLISGFKILQIHKTAGRKSVEVAQIIGLPMWEKLEMMMADSENFGQFNWTPNLPKLRHKKVLNYRHN